MWTWKSQRGTAPQVGVLAVKLDAGIQAADALERGTAHGEVAAVEDRADPQQGLDQRLRQRRHGHVVGADQRAPAQVPVVEAIRRRDGNQRRPFQESALDLLEPLERGTAIGVDVHQDVAGCVGAVVVDDDDLVRGPRLRQQ